MHVYLLYQNTPREDRLNGVFDTPEAAQARVQSFHPGVGGLAWTRSFRCGVEVLVSETTKWTIETVRVETRQQPT